MLNLKQVSFFKRVSEKQIINFAFGSLCVLGFGGFLTLAAIMNHKPGQDKEDKTEVVPDGGKKAMPVPTKSEPSRTESAYIPEVTFHFKNEKAVLEKKPKLEKENDKKQNPKRPERPELPETPFYESDAQPVASENRSKNKAKNAPVGGGEGNGPAKAEIPAKPVFTRMPGRTDSVDIEKNRK